MARAKRTARAEARRRYRATLATTARRGRRRADGRRPPAPAGARHRTPRRRASRDRAARPRGSASSPPSGRDPARPRPGGPRLAAVDRAPHQGALGAGADHDRQHGVHGRDGANDMVTGCCSPTSSTPGDRWRVHRRVPGAAGELAARRVVGLVAAICYVALLVAGLLPVADLRRAAADADRRRGLARSSVAGHRRASCRRRGLVSAVPAAVDPEPEPTPVEARSSARATAGRAVLGRSARRRRRRRASAGSALTQCAAVPTRFAGTVRRHDSRSISRAGASRRGRAGGRPPADPARRPRRPPRGVAGSTGRSR